MNFEEIIHRLKELEDEIDTCHEAAGQQIWAIKAARDERIAPLLTEQTALLKMLEDIR